MRAILDIADDVLLAVRERAQRERRSEGEVLSDLARKSLAQRSKHEEPEGFFGFKPFPHRGAPVTNDLINKLREEELV